VSLILSGREEYVRQFHPDTVEKVRKSADRLGYRTNLFASGLPSKATTFFAVVLQEVGNREVSTWHHWAFEGDLLAGIIQAASERNVYPIVATAHPQADEAALRPLESIIAGGVFGTIVRTPGPPLEKYLRSQLKRGQLVVVVFPSRIESWPTNAIDVDNVAIGRLAGRLLAHHGRSRWGVAWFGKKGADPHLLRLNGLLESAKEAGASVEMFQVPLGIDDMGIREVLAPKLAQRDVDGLFAVDSISSVGTLYACLKLGWEPGRDYNLVGCDCAFWEGPSLPKITSVDISWHETGITALNQLCEVMQQGESQFETVLVQPRVTPAATCPVPAELAGDSPPSVRASAPAPTPAGEREVV
jgi:LacI family repressor for deo operon, udp, cdd, tsx, nupC, and nupG